MSEAVPYRLVLLLASIASAVQALSWRIPPIGGYK